MGGHAEHGSGSRRARRWPTAVACVLGCLAQALLFRCLEVIHEDPDTHVCVGKGRIIKQSQARRPNWTDETVGRAADQVMVVGRSWYVDDLQVGLRQAEVAALEQVVSELSRELARDARWSELVLARVSAHRDGPMRALEALTTAERPDPAQLEAARAAVYAGRERVAAALRHVAGPLMPSAYSDSYWEQFRTRVGSRTRVAVLYSVPTGDFQKLRQMFGTVVEARGVSAVTYFPGLAWHEGSRRGVIVVGAGAGGAAESLGLRGGDVILEIDGIPVVTASAFVKTVEVRSQTLCVDGGGAMAWSVAREGLPVHSVRVAVPGGCRRGKPSCTLPVKDISQ